MKIAFVSNYFNHHQKPLSDALYRLTEGQYRFIATEAMTQERIQLGWGGDSAPYVLQYADAPAECQQWIGQADAVLWGSAPYDLLKTRLRSKRLTFLYSERIYKRACPKWQIPLRAMKYYWKYGRYSNLYLLCASAYTASDYAKTGTFRGKAYAWGYFPEVKAYDSVQTLIAQKEPGSIVWTARFLDWKHPELPLQLAKSLKEKGYAFSIDLIGTGPMEQEIQGKIIAYDLQDRVHLLGAMKPEEVRVHMERARIFLLTSDRNEGWGAVLNEAMNSGCAVVASRAAGATPMLVQHGENGLIYDTQDELNGCVEALLKDQARCRQYGQQAYQTMQDEWNADEAAERLLRLIQDIQISDCCTAFSKGPCRREE